MVTQARGQRAKKARRRRRGFGTIDEQRDLAERILTPAGIGAVANAMPRRYRVLVLAAAWSGLRQGELLALTRGDLDLGASPPVLRVRLRLRRTDNGAVDIDTPEDTRLLANCAVAAAPPRRVRRAPGRVRGAGT
jgi:integrase